MTAAAIYHVLGGLIVLCFPQALINVLNTSSLEGLGIQFIGISLLSMGLAFAFASFEPIRQWVQSVLGLGFHLSLFILIGVQYIQGNLGQEWLSLWLSNAVVWLGVFGMLIALVLRERYRADDMLITSFGGDHYPLELFETESGKNLQELSDEKPLLLVFLRHFGCPFCKDSLEQLARRRPDFERRGVRVVLVHMVDDSDANNRLKTFNLDDLERISDPESMLYKRFGLRRGRPGELFGWTAIKRATYLALNRKYFISSPVGDSEQMPGIFLVIQGQIVDSFVHKSAADRPNYMRMLSSLDRRS